MNQIGDLGDSETMRWKKVVSVFWLKKIWQLWLKKIWQLLEGRRCVGN